MQYTFIAFLHNNNGISNVQLMPHFWWQCTEI